MQHTPGGNDYQIALIDFPHGVLGAVRLMNDGTYYVFLSTCLTAEWQKRVLDHELRHIDHNHLYNDILTVRQMEDDADKRTVIDKQRTIPLFKSFDALWKATLWYFDGDVTAK